MGGCGWLWVGYLWGFGGVLVVMGVDRKLVLVGYLWVLVGFWWGFGGVLVGFWWLWEGYLRVMGVDRTA